MRLRKKSLKKCYLKNKIIEEDGEGGKYDAFGESIPINAEVWQASGKIQAEIYGKRLTYIKNMLLDGAYTIETNESDRPYYQFSYFQIMEGDGICLYVSADRAPDYRIIAIYPNPHLRLEVEKI